MIEDKIGRSLNDNEKQIKSILGESSDIIIRNFVIPAFNNCRAFILFIDGLTGTKELDDIILKPLMTNAQSSIERNFAATAGPIRALKEAGLLSPSVNETQKWNEIFDAVLCGDTALFIEAFDTAIIMSTRGYESRSVSEPLSESEVRSARDGFIENIRVNTSLIRRRIRDYSLRMDAMKIGERTKTDVILVYIDNLVNKGILEELKKRLNRIKVDSILESGYIEEFIEDAPQSIFPTIEHTERPDKAAAAILEGRIAILIDNTPFCLVVPTVFWQYIQATGDYYERYYIGTFIRWLRLFALFVSLTLSSFYVMLSEFHQEMYPTLLALRIAAGREGVPFPAILEVLLMETIFEIMREAGLRMPKPVGQAVGIVGALVMGEAAVSAGLVGPILVIVVSAAGISSFAVPAYSMSTSFRLLRFPLILLSGSFGILGFLGGTIVITLHLLSLRSFGAPFLTPIDPFRLPGNKDVLIRAPWWMMKKRPRITQPQDFDRQADSEQLKPKPPTNN
ncbi:spore germination protein [Clostridium swellfunianum]|uniref:spore germination protein n=1 Tax=Clostridium swellfunianum TaxID=1367462 RepID=UPI00202E910A|nr:spore germination protein [Clostridium swellfunianum]MCM0650781.1 spore germination protein [Clostridium swellfunianum]